MIPVILSGGAGSRLWPLSRTMYPKQLLPLAHSEQSMLQQTVRRAQGLAEATSPIVVCNNDHRFVVAEQLKDCAPSATIMLEPCARNTAAAIALAAHYALSGSEGKSADDPLLLVMPADHVIQDSAAFQQAVRQARPLAEEGRLVTFGVVPTHAETGYGYIQRAVALKDGFEIAAFHEKPDADTAQRYVEGGDYYWNAGIFLFTAGAFLQELERFASAINTASEKAVHGASLDLDFLRIDETAFTTSPAESIDYAVMEKTQRAAVVPLDAGWNDVGSWAALWEVLPKDPHGNAMHGDVLLHDTENSFIYAETKLVAALGLDGLIVVETDDAVMVAPRERAQDVKSLVEKLKAENRTQPDHHRKVYRPWGWYDSIDTGKNFQAKRIQVKPGAKLSTQKHFKRAEHWVVVAGTAEVLKGEEWFTLSANESTYIPIEMVHALRNPSPDVPLEIIEVQTGSYLGEDDIVRYEDLYGRS